jgi:hypothetical protein
VVEATDAIVTPTTATRAGPQGSSTYRKIVSKITGNLLLRRAIHTDTLNKCYKSAMPSFHKTRLATYMKKKQTPKTPASRSHF